METTIKRKMLLASTASKIMAILGLISSAYILGNPCPRLGLEALAFIPFLYCVLSLIYSEIFLYDSIGIKIYLGINFIRCVVSPLLISMSFGEISAARMSVVEPVYYRVAVLIQCLEIIIAYTSIKKYYTLYERKFSEKETVLSNNTIELSFKNATGMRSGGWIVVALYVFILLLRFGEWAPALTIFGIKESSGVPGTIDNVLFSVVKTILFITSLYNCIKSETEQQHIFWVIVCVITLMFSVFTYFGSNRSSLIEIALASYYLIIFYNPKYKKKLLIFGLPLFMLMFINVFVTKQFAAEAIGESTSVAGNIKLLSNQIEEYTNGLWCIAQSYKASVGLSINLRFQALIREIVEGLQAVTTLPIINVINNATSDWLPASQIMKHSFEIYDRGQMMSFSGGIFIEYGFLGWILMPVYTTIAMKILCYTSKKYYYERSILKKYCWVWISILFGLTHCYCVQTLLFCLSKYILFLFFIIWANRFVIDGR